MQPLRGTEGANFPFWSPDGKQIGFFADSKLKRVAIDGGAIQTICDASDGRGGTWNEEDVILFTPSTAAALFRVAAPGGKPEPVTALVSEHNENSHRWPVFLNPQKFIFMSRTPAMTMGQSFIYIATLPKSGPTVPIKLVASEYRAAYAGGYL